MHHPRRITKGAKRHRSNSYVWGQSNENRTPVTKWQWKLFYSKAIARSINKFIPAGDETIYPSLLERGKSLMDPLPHPLLHFLVRMKPTSMNVFLQVAKNVEVTKGKIWAVRRMLKCFPAKSLKRIPHQIGDGRYHAKCWSRPTAFHGFWLYRVFQHPQPQRNEPHISALLPCLHFQCWMNTLYTMLTSRVINNCLDLCFLSMHVSYPIDGSIDI